MNKLSRILNKIFRIKKNKEKNSCCKCCISDIEERLVEVSEEKKEVIELKKTNTDIKENKGIKTNKKATVKKSSPNKKTT